MGQRMHWSHSGGNAWPVSTESSGLPQPQQPTSASGMRNRTREGPLHYFTGERGASGAAGGARPGFRREGGLALSRELEFGPIPKTQQPRSSDTHEKNQARVPRRHTWVGPCAGIQKWPVHLGLETPRPPSFAFLFHVRSDPQSVTIQK